MSEEAIREIFGDEAAEVEQAESQETQESEQHKRFDGVVHQTLEQWTASGKDPADWKTPEEFEEEGRRIKYQKPLRRELQKQAEDFNRRLENVNKLHRIQLEQERNKLLLERDNAIDTADRTEVRRLDQALEQNKQLQNELASEPQKPAEVVEWESENQWIFDPEDPRTAPAIAAFTEAQQAGKTMASCILAADRAAAKIQTTAPSVKRTAMPAADTPKARQVSGGKIQLTMKDLTAEERQFRSFYNTEKEFLQAVADDRAGDKR